MTKTKFTTPAGRLTWPKLQTPDCYRKEGQKPKDDDKYHFSTGIVLDPEDEKVAAFLAEVRPYMDDLGAAEAAIPKKKPMMKDPLYSINPELDQEGNETGMIELKFRVLAWGIKNGKRWDREVPLLDHNNKPLEDGGQELGNGTIAQISFEPRAYNSGGGVGVSMQLRAARVLAPKYYAPKDDPGNDFDDNEISAEEFESIQEVHGANGDF